MLFFVADGTLARNRVVFHFAKERKVQAVIALLESLEIEYVLSRYSDTSAIRFDQPWWVRECYAENGEKKYPDCIWRVTEDAYAAFYEATLDSDGCRANLEINTFSSECANQLQVVSLLNNKAMNIRQYKGGLYKQSYLTTSYISFRKDQLSLDYRNGKHRVVCFSVPSSYLVVRRSGVVFVSGNCEIMTHRLFSRNAASSRAIPVQRTLDAVRSTPFVPFHWGKNQAGMQAYEVLRQDVQLDCIDEWIWASKDAAMRAETLLDMGLHKQIANRLLEPFMFITVILSTTSFRHFELLRNHPMAEPHFQYLAQLMVKAREESIPELLQAGQWHLPLIYEEDKHLSLEDQKKVSVARCARVSYVRQNEIKDYSEDFALHDRLVGSDPKHSSPTEHQATPSVCKYWPSGAPTFHMVPNQIANFLGWKQYRKEIEGEFIPDLPYMGPTR